MTPHSQNDQQLRIQGSLDCVPYQEYSMDGQHPFEDFVRRLGLEASSELDMKIFEFITYHVCYLG